MVLGKVRNILKDIILLIIGITSLIFNLFIAFLAMFAASIGYYDGGKRNTLKTEKLKLNEKDKEIIADYTIINNEKV